MWRRSLRSSLMVLALIMPALIVEGCGHESRPAALAPTAPSMPSVFSEVTGNIIDTALRPIAGVTIEIVDGAEAGRSAVSDVDGRFAFTGGAFDNGITYRAARDGYVTQTVTGALALSWPGPKATLLITLESTDTPARIPPGDYVVTLLTDPSCTDLPEHVRTRSYATTVTAYSDTRYFLRMQGLVRGLDQLMVGVAGRELHFDNDEGLLEQIVPGQLNFFGVGDATVDGPSVPSPLEFTVSGVVAYCTSSRPPSQPYGCGGPNDPPVFLRCSSNRHRLVLAQSFVAAGKALAASPSGTDTFLRRSARW